MTETQIIGVVVQLASLLAFVIGTGMVAGILK